MNCHLHEFKVECEASGSHKHRIHGYTKNTVGFNVLHLHHFWGISSYDGHTHYYSGTTGLPIKTENGHIHIIEGILDVNNRHGHRFDNFTYEEIEYCKKKPLRAVYV